MIENQRIPRYKFSIPDSEVSDGTPPVYADSEARSEGVLQKRKFISDRADKILYFPILKFGREDSDASRRFITWDIEIYNQIIVNMFQVSKILVLIQETAGRDIRRVTWRSRRAAFAALTRALTSEGRGCVSAWSLAVIPRRRFEI